MNRANIDINKSAGPELSQRLLAVASLVTPGCSLADIGTDHAYVPAYLVMKGIVPSAVAMDVGRGPLERAQHTVEKYGLSDRITTRLSDGLQGLGCGEADSIVIAGMGGGLTIRILEHNSMKTLNQAAPKELVLAPQSEIALVRQFLRQHNWMIDAEDMILEDGKYYQMMRAHSVQADDYIKSKAGGHEIISNPSDVVYDPKDKSMPGDIDSEEWQAVQDLYGPQLLGMHHPVLKQYLTWEYGVLQKIERQLQSANGNAAAERRKELAEKFRRNRMAYELVNRPGY